MCIQPFMRRVVKVRCVLMYELQQLHIQTTQRLRPSTLPFPVVSVSGDLYAHYTCQWCMNIQELQAPVTDA